jgi:hypothetical protein
MTNSISKSNPRFLFRCAPVVAGLVLFSLGAAAQQPAANSIENQREAMSKLAFLAGRWSGPVTVTRGPGEPLRLTQTEDVQFKLGGLVLLIEGKSTGADGKSLFEALATVAFDDAAHTYRLRAYNEGRYLDTELSAAADGFSWGLVAGPAHIVNTMRLTPKGEWQETTEVTVGDNPPRRAVEMLLTRQP